MSDRPRYAIIPSNGRDCLLESKYAIKVQVDQLIVVWATQDDGYPNPPWWGEDRATIFYYPGPRTEANISQWWNEGLKIAQDHFTHWYGSGEWDVAILNDDAIVPEGWFDAVSTAMREYGAAAACSGSTIGTRFFTEPGPIPGISNPLTGFAFILAGEKGLRANEDLHWYCGDNDLDWRSRQAGGTLMMSGFPVRHLYPNGQMTPEMHAQTGRDMQTFVDIWGQRPW